MPDVPPLAARSGSELATHLRLSRDGQSQNLQMLMAKRLADDEVQALAAFLSKQSLN